MVVRTTLGALVLVTAGWGFWSAFTERADTGTAADRRQHELLKLNIDQPADPELAATFAAINARHFFGNLPPTPVRWEPRLSEVGALAGGTFSLEGMFGHVGKRTAILLNPNLRSDARALERALCHEIVHAHLFSLGETTTSHGATFQRVLRRLSEEGAFQGILADATERANLRTWLDGESARLDAEHLAMTRVAAAIERERVDLERDVADLNARIRAAHKEGGPRPAEPEIETMNRRRDAYSERVVQAKARSEHNTADLAAFNREVARYNLMLLYPDGVDEDAILRPKIAGPVGVR